MHEKEIKIETCLCEIFNKNVEIEIANHILYGRGSYPVDIRQTMKCHDFQHINE